jgi:hypothetical protein
VESITASLDSTAIMMIFEMGVFEMVDLNRYTPRMLITHK